MKRCDGVNQAQPISSGPTPKRKRGCALKRLSVLTLPPPTLAAIRLRAVGNGEPADVVYRSLKIDRFGVRFNTFRAFVSRLRGDARIATARTKLRGRRPDRMSPRRLPKSILSIVRRLTLEQGYSASSTYRALRLGGFGVKENTFVKYIKVIRSQAGIPCGETLSRRHVVAHAVAAIIVGEFDLPGQVRACLAAVGEIIETAYHGATIGRAGE